MSRHQQRVRLYLDPKTTTSLPIEDLRAILRAADELIDRGGRNLLTKILKGSRANNVLSHNLDRNPFYGFYRHLAAEEILARIDWTILNGYLRVIYDGRLPLLVYTAAGWYIERETVADEIVAGFDSLLAGAQRPYDMVFLKDRNREMILRVLEKVRASGDSKYLPVLEDWERIDYKKVREKIRETMQSLQGNAAWQEGRQP